MLTRKEQAAQIIDKAKEGYDKMGRGIVVAGLYPHLIYKPHWLVIHETNDETVRSAVNQYDPENQVALLWHNQNSRKDWFKVIDFADLRKFGLPDGE